MSDWYARLREHTLCRLGWHCRPDRRIQKFDGGRLPLLCRYCYLITGHADAKHAPESSAPVPQEGRDMAREAIAASGNFALLAEMERGWARSDHRKRDRRDPAPRDPAPRAADGDLHAFEITPDDAAFLRMMAGARFGPDARVTLPSGKTVTGTEMAKWIEGNPS